MNHFYDLSEEYGSLTPQTPSFTVDQTPLGPPTSSALQPAVLAAMEIGTHEDNRNYFDAHSFIDDLCAGYQDDT